MKQHLAISVVLVTTVALRVLLLSGHENGFTAANAKHKSDDDDSLTELSIAEAANATHKSDDDHSLTELSIAERGAKAWRRPSQGHRVPQMPGRLARRQQGFPLRGCGAGAVTNAALQPTAESLAAQNCSLLSSTTIGCDDDCWSHCISLDVRVHTQLERYRGSKVAGLLENKLLVKSALKAMGLPYMVPTYGAVISSSAAGWPRYERSAFVAALSKGVHGQPAHSGFVVKPATDGEGANVHAFCDTGAWDRQQLTEGGLVAKIERESLLAEERVWGQRYEHRAVLIEPCYCSARDAAAADCVEIKAMVVLGKVMSIRYSRLHALLPYNNETVYLERRSLSNDDARFHCMGVHGRDPRCKQASGFVNRPAVRVKLGEWARRAQQFFFLDWFRLDVFTRGPHGSLDSWRVNELTYPGGHKTGLAWPTLLGCYKLQWLAERALIPPAVMPAAQGDRMEPRVATLPKMERLLAAPVAELQLELAHLAKQRFISVPEPPLLRIIAHRMNLSLDFAAQIEHPNARPHDAVLADGERAAAAEELSALLRRVFDCDAPTSERHHCVRDWESRASLVEPSYRAETVAHSTVGSTELAPRRPSSVQLLSLAGVDPVEPPARGDDGFLETCARLGMPWPRTRPLIAHPYGALTLAPGAPGTHDKHDGRDIVVSALRRRGPRPLLLELGVALGGSMERWLQASPSVRVLGLDPIGNWTEYVDALTTRDARMRPFRSMLPQLAREGGTRDVILGSLWPFRERACLVEGFSPHWLPRLGQGLSPDVVYIDNDKSMHDLWVAHALWPNAVLAGDDWGHQRAWAGQPSPVRHAARRTFNVTHDAGLAVCDFARKMGFWVEASKVTFVLHRPPIAAGARDACAPACDAAMPFGVACSRGFVEAL